MDPKVKLWSHSEQFLVVEYVDGGSTINQNTSVVFARKDVDYIVFLWCL